MRRVLRPSTIVAWVLALAACLAYGTPALAAPSIVVSPASGPPGGSFTVTGAGFTANETGIAVTYDGTVVASGITANSLGGWAVTVIVPPSASGTHVIDASGNVTPATTVPNVSFTVTPAISASRTTGTSGTSVAIAGVGFAASETGIAITWDGVAVASGIAANAQGAWGAGFTVPLSTAGTHIIDAYGVSTAATAVPDVVFQVVASIAINPTTGAPGVSITVAGVGFGANESGIRVSYDGNSVGSGVTANAQGNWSTSVAVPPSPAGLHSISASGPVTSAASVPTMTFTVTPGLSLSRTGGGPGTSVTVSGVGFASGETGITVTYDGAPVASGITANSQGSWSAALTVPTSASGPHTVTAYGATTPAPSVPSAVFTVIPGISLGRATGPPGTAVTVTGSSFGATELDITVTYDGTPIATGISANAQGAWTTTVTIPPSAAGPHTIDASGPATSASSVPNVVFSVTPVITMTPAFGFVGSTVDIKGAGFAAASALTFTYDEKAIPVQVSTDPFGSFSRSITIPKSVAGPHIVRVVDGQRNGSEVTFTMDSTPPPTPRPLSPEDGARVGLVGDVRPTFRWTAVTDPSGVIYVLQLDTNPDFVQPILERTDISATSYTPGASEALSHGQYYWRVKAVDGASNESPWTPPQMVTASLMSLSTLLILVTLLVLLAGFAAYFLTRRLAARRREAVRVPAAGFPEVIQGQWRMVEPEEGARPRPLPWRLSLPQPTRQAKVISTEDQARLKVIADFAQSLPLVEPGYNMDWVLNLVETSMGIEATAAVQAQLLKDELQVHYEPAWMRHPTYQDLLTLLEEQPILAELSGFVEGVNRGASAVLALLREIYHEATPDAPPDFLDKGGWRFVASVYADAISWFVGRSLQDPSERDYIITPASGGGEAAAGVVLEGGQATAFAGPLFEAPGQDEATRLRALHLKLRRAYRAKDSTRQVMTMLAQLEVQRSRLLSVLSQFGRIASAGT